MKFNDLAEKVTAEIISELEKGNVVWQRPFYTTGAAQNAITHRLYEGFNQFYLSWVANRKGYTLPWFLTFQQAKELGGHVRKGENGTPVIYWKITNRSGDQEQEGKAGAAKRSFYPFVHFLFNIDQVEGISFDLPTTSNPVNNPIGEAEKIIAGMPNPPAFIHEICQPYYDPATDQLNIPDISGFTTSEGYYCTKFHELVHSTGHYSRLNRFKPGEKPARFGDAEYSKEELLAEMGASYLCAAAGIMEPVFQNSIGYLQSWIKVLRNDKALIIHAAGKATKAAAYILNNETTEPDSGDNQIKIPVPDEAPEELCLTY